MMKTTKKSRRKGLLVEADDLELGQYYTVYGLKNGPDELVPIAGMAFKLTAMNLPFVIGKSAANPALEPLTFDIRFLNFTADFVTAQRSGTPA
jgi:hypothetical protein